MTIINTKYLNNQMIQELYGWAFTKYGITIYPFIERSIFDIKTKKCIKHESIFNPEYVIENVFKDILKKDNKEWRKEWDEWNENERRLKNRGAEEQ